jgi:hypothetical protein
MPEISNIIDRLSLFKHKDKFSLEIWERRGLIQSDKEMCDGLNSIFNKIIDELTDEIDKNQTTNKLKSILKNGLKSINKANYDTEEKEFICDVFIELSGIVNIDIKADTNKWLYGSAINLILQAQKLIKSKKVALTLTQPCFKCGVQLETIITEIETNIPSDSWLIVKCNNCKAFNLISIGPNIKGLRFEGYERIESLSKTEYTQEQAIIRLEQIKYFRK